MFVIFFTILRSQKVVSQEMAIFENIFYEAPVGLYSNYHPQSLLKVLGEHFITGVKWDAPGHGADPT